MIGSYILAAKNETHNRYALYFYYLPAASFAFVIFFVGQVALLPLCYVKILAHKFALVVKNPKGFGQKAVSDRFGFAIFWLIFGIIILLINCFVDSYYFVKHLLYLNLDVAVAKQKKEDRGLGINKGIGRGVFKQMLIYFDLETGADKQKIALQKDVSRDLREYLDIEKSIVDIILGGMSKNTPTGKLKKGKSLKDDFDDLNQDKKGD